MIAREPIYAALFAKVAGAADFVTAGRRFRHWSDITPAEQPALFMRQKAELGSLPAPGAPTVWRLLVELYVYAHASDPYVAPAEVLNPLLDAVEGALAPSAVTGMQDLGTPAMVRHAGIAGKIETPREHARPSATKRYSSVCYSIGNPATAGCAKRVGTRAPANDQQSDWPKEAIPNCGVIG